MSEDRRQKTQTFEISGDVSDNVFEDIETTADTVLVARGAMTRNRWRGLRHAPAREGSGHEDGRKRDWARIGALAAVAALPLAGIAIVVTAVAA